MHTYDDDCEITFENVWSNFDHYYLCHLLGWFVLGFMIRDRFLLHSWGLMDEIVELSWQHILPHFRECWWDHVFIDVLFSNTVGIELSLFVIRITGMNMFDWLGTKDKKSWRDWDVFNCHRHFGFLMSFYIWVVGRFIGMFFFMNAMLLPPYHRISIIRVVTWAFFSFLPFREIYEDIHTWNTPERKTQRVEGNYRWLGSAVIGLECLTSYKFRLGTGNMNEGVETPLYIIIPWVVGLSTMSAFYLYLRFKKDRTKKFRELTTSASDNISSKITGKTKSA